MAPHFSTRMNRAHLQQSTDIHPYINVYIHIYILYMFRDNAYEQDECMPIHAHAYIHTYNPMDINSCMHTFTSTNVQAFNVCNTHTYIYLHHTRTKTQVLIYERSISIFTNIHTCFHTNTSNTFFTMCGSYNKSTPRNCCNPADVRRQNKGHLMTRKYPLCCTPWAT
jgi:hypothetical protein